jgi:hypothetical protein
MEKLVVLDHCTNTIHVYNLDKEDFISEDYIQNLGFNVGNCNWMAGEIEVVKHNEILK